MATVTRETRSTREKPVPVNFRYKSHTDWPEIATGSLLQGSARGICRLAWKRLHVQDNICFLFSEVCHNTFLLTQHLPSAIRYGRPIYFINMTR